MRSAEQHSGAYFFMQDIGVHPSELSRLVITQDALRKADTRLPTCAKRFSGSSNARPASTQHK